MDFDDMLITVGDYGKYQKHLLFVFLIPTAMLSPLFTNSDLFFVSLPDHWCNVPELLCLNLSVKQEQLLVRPKSDSSCSVYDVNYTDLLLTSRDWTIPANTTTKRCENGWNYDKTNYDFTAATQWNMVCEHRHYTSLVLMMASVGSTVLTPAYGFYSDRCGRKPLFFLIALITFIASITSVFVTNFKVFIVLRTIVGGALPSIFQIPYIILLEIVGPNLRTYINGIHHIAWTTGLCFIPLLAWLARDWVTLGLITSSVIVLLFFYWPFLPESPRWLLSKQNYEEAAKILFKIAKKNGKQVNVDDILCNLKKIGERIKKETAEEKEERNKLWKYPRLRRNFFIITYVMTAVTGAYCGLQINGSSLSGNEFIIFFLLAIAELPGCICGWIIIEKVGRRWCSVFGLALSAIACLVAAIYIETSVAASFVGKLAINITVMSLCLQSSELYPTSVRSFGISLSSSCARIATIIVPYIVYFRKYGEWIPFIIFAFLAITASFLVAFLPETLNESLPQTVADAEEFGVTQKFFSCNRKKSSYQVDSPPPLPKVAISLNKIACTLSHEHKETPKIYVLKQAF